MQHAGRPAASEAARFSCPGHRPPPDGMDIHVRIVQKGWNRPMALAPPPTQATAVGRAAFGLQYPFAGFPADHRLKIPHHGRIRMRTGHRADDVIGVVNIETQSRRVSFMASFKVAEPRSRALRPRPTSSSGKHWGPVAPRRPPPCR